MLLAGRRSLGDWTLSSCPMSKPVSRQGLSLLAASSHACSRALLVSTLMLGHAFLSISYSYKTFWPTTAKQPSMEA